MPETLVMAQVTVDASGVVKNLGAVDAAVDKTGKNLQDFGDSTSKVTEKIEERFFSLRHVAGAVLGGFTLAGMVEEFKGLGVSVLESSANFKDFAASTEIAEDSIASAVGRIININQALSDSTTYLNTFSNVMDKQGQPSETSGWLWQILWGLLPYGQAAGMLQQAREFLHAGAQELDKSGLAKRDSPALYYGPKAPEWFDDQGHIHFGYKPPAYEKPTPAIRVPEQEFSAFQGQISAMGNEMLSDGIFSPKAQAAMAKTWDSLQKGLEGVNPEFITAVRNVKDLSDGFQEFREVGVAAMDAVGAAVSAGVLSQVNAARLQEALQATLATQQGFIQLAEAAASLALPIPDVRAAVLHKIAAGLYFTAAAFHGIGAIAPASSGGGGGGGGGGYGSSALTSQRDTRPAPVLHIHIDGQITPGTENRLAREVVRLWQMGAKDQGGGQTVVSQAKPW